MSNVFKNQGELLLKALFETFEMIIFSMIISLFFGLLIGFVLFLTRKGSVYKNNYIYLIISTIVNVFRSVPFILFIIVLIPITRIVVGTGFGVDASKFPLSLIGIATFARLAEQALISVDKNIYETSYSLGANTNQYFRYFLIKESSHLLVLSFTSTIISLISYSMVVGVIAGGGLGQLAITEGYQNFNYPLMWVTIIMIVIIVQLVQGLGNLIAKKIDKR